MENWEKRLRAEVASGQGPATVLRSDLRAALVELTENRASIAEHVRWVLQQTVLKCSNSGSAGAC